MCWFPETETPSEEIYTVLAVMHHLYIFNINVFLAIKLVWLV